MNYVVTLRSGLSPKAEVLKELGSAKTFEDALTLAVNIASNPANVHLLGCRSYYIRRIVYKENVCEGIDYGSHTKFIVVDKVENA